MSRKPKVPGQSREPLDGNQDQHAQVHGEAVRVVAAQDVDRSGRGRKVLEDVGVVKNGGEVAHYFKYEFSQFLRWALVRVVKEMCLRHTGVDRAGSNPAGPTNLFALFWSI